MKSLTNSIFISLKNWFTPPVFEGDEDKTRIASHVYFMYELWLIASIIFGIILPIVTGNLSSRSVITLLVMALSFFQMALIKKGFVRSAAILLVCTTWLFINYTVLVTGGVRAVGFGGNLIIVLIAGMLISLNAALLFGFMSTLLGLGMAIAQSQGFLPPIPANVNAYTAWLTQGVFLMLITGVLYLTLHDLQQALKKTRRAEARLSSLVENSPATILEINRKSEIIFTNSNPDLVLGVNTTQFLEPEDRAWVSELIEQIFETQESKTIEVKVNVPGGALSWNSISFGPIFNGNEVTSQVLIATNINAAKEAELLVKQRADQLTTIVEIGRAVSTLQDLENVLEIIYQQIQHIAPVDAFYICLLSDDKKHLTFPLTYDLGVRYNEPDGQLRPESRVAKIIQTGEPYRLHRTAEEVTAAEKNTNSVGNSQRKSGSLLFVPLWQAREVIGVLSIQSYALNAYPDELVETLSGIADQAAIAIQNARLFTNVQQELTERQRTEARLRGVFENSPDNILEIDRAGQVKFINRHAERYLGKNIRDVLPADQLDTALTMIERAFISGEPQAFELQTIGPDNRVSWDSIRIGPVKHGDQITSLTVIMTEITAQKNAEAALRAREELYRLISTITADYVFSTQLEADGQLHSNWVGGAFESITGYTFKDYVAQGGWQAALHPDDREKDAHDMASLRANQNIISEMRTFHKSGEMRWVRVYAHPLWDSERDQLTGIYGAVQDITERKQAEAERELFIKELEAKNAELERFNYTVSHELKSPIVTIKGFLGSIAKDIHDEKYERAQKDLLRISTAADKMHDTLSDLLELSRIGRIANASEEIDLVQLAHEALETTHGRIQSRNITVHIAPDLPPVCGDRIRLREVYENLLDNAAKYFGDQTMPLIEIGARNDGSEIIYFVKDNGIGIDTRYHKRIFGLFDKLDATSEGTGIGLALVKRIIETHGGKVWVESKGLGKGSTFCFTIPDTRKQGN